jgi:hypothetical protein
MPTPVSALFAHVGLPVKGPIPFGLAPPSLKPGIYIVSDNDSAVTVSLTRMPSFRADRLREWIKRAREMNVAATRARPTVDVLQRVLTSWWLKDEPALYIGMTTRPLGKRVLEFAKTPIGAGRPHAGGFWLQTLGSPLFVFWAECDQPDHAEDSMLALFANGVSDNTRRELPDMSRVMPWANLEWPRGARKPHGLSKQTSKV